MSQSQTDQLPAGNPVDAIVSRLLHNMQSTQRGFVLDLAPHMSGDLRERLKTLHTDLAEDGTTDESLLVAIDQAIDAASGTSISIAPPITPLPLIDNRLPKAARRWHQLHDTDSFIAYCERYGKPGKSLVMVDRLRAVVILDEQITEGEREYGIYNFATSKPFDVWRGSIGQRVQHADFYDFILTNQHDVQTEKLLMHVANANVSVSVKGISLLGREQTEHGVIFKAAIDSEAVNIPGQFDIALPVLEADIAAKEVTTFRIDLTPIPPRNPGEKPTLNFVMNCAAMTTAVQERAAVEAGVIREALGDGDEDWCVLSGAPAYMSPRMGHGQHAAEIADARDYDMDLDE